jgi:hypothetical protein
LAGRGDSWICLAGLAACSRGWGHPPSPRSSTTAWPARWATGCGARGPGDTRRCAVRLAARGSSSYPPVRCRSLCRRLGPLRLGRPPRAAPPWRRVRSSSRTRLGSRHHGPGGPAPVRRVRERRRRLPRADRRQSRRPGRLRLPAGPERPVGGRRRRSIRGRGLELLWRQPWPGQASWRPLGQPGDPVAVRS